MPLAYSSTQKAQIIDFAQVTHIDKSTAAKLLKASGWSTKGALEQFFSSQSNAAANAHKSQLKKLFDKYREDAVNEPDEINIDGTMRMMGDLDIDLEDVGSFVFAELVQSPSLGKITRAEFVESLSKHDVSDLDSIRDLVQKRRSQMAQAGFQASFRDIYKHAFVIARPAGRKLVPLDMAIEYWKALFTAPSLAWSSRGADWLEWWLEFLQQRSQAHPDKESFRSVNKDMWNETLNFANKTLADPSLSFWSEDSAWPSVIDEFVEYLRTEKAVGVGESGGTEQAMDTT